VQEESVEHGRQQSFKGIIEDVNRHDIQPTKIAFFDYSAKKRQLFGVFLLFLHHIFDNKAMLTEKTMEKLRILAESAKYDVSCSSSGTVRSGTKGMLGNTVGGMGICHSFADDGRCISLLKVMLTNHCMYDCAYCINRRTNDIRRATLSVSELEEITMEFYRRNYIEGLFLSSGVVRNPDYTMERLTAIVRDLRTVHRFNGYIHLKTIPGASQELLQEAGRYADRMSVNIEIPKEASLKALAPEKDHRSVFLPMKQIQQGVLENKEDRKKFRHAPRFVPAGQSTQMIVGATMETDLDILQMSDAMYHQPTMRRVYYSGYVSVNTYDPRLPVLKQPPLVRENRLYQADWLMRFYHFSVDEIVDDKHAHLDLDVDPKLGWALRHPEFFPVDINKASYEEILRVPGIGVKSAVLIVNSRRFNRITTYHLKKMGVVLKKAKYFITCGELTSAFSQPVIGVNELRPERLRPLLLSKAQQKRAAEEQQLTLDFKD
jgi:putative DNA modification/repair radical SAM protein